MILPSDIKITNSDHIVASASIFTRATVMLRLTIADMSVKPEKELAVIVSHSKDAPESYIRQLAVASMQDKCKGLCPAYGKQILDYEVVK